MFFRSEHHGYGSTPQLACPIKLTGTPANVYRGPPQLGEHNDEIRAELARRREALKPSDGEDDRRQIVTGGGVDRDG